MEELKTLLEELKQQEEQLQFTEFTNDTAYAIGTRLVEIAKRDNKGVTIDITRFGQQLFHCALPGTTVDNDDWIKRKNRVVGRFFHSSYYVGLHYKSQNTSLEQKRPDLDQADYAAHGGAFPIIIKNVGVVGTITVSGLPQEEDHRMVVSVLKEYLGIK